MKHILLGGIALIIFINLGHAQKVKYKSLFVLLNAENYQDGDPFLRRFLVGEPDHPNATYQMGKMMASYMRARDLMTDSGRINELGDSAKLYFRQALQLNTEKYVEKQHDDDYYAEFKRRDLRTGKFIVKLSDLQLDIESRIEKIDTYQDNVLQLNTYFQTTDRQYAEVLRLYSALTAKAETLKLLYFTSDGDDLQTLRDITIMYDSCINNFNNYSELMKAIGGKTISQKLVIEPIESYPIDLSDTVKFNSELVTIKNFGDWSKNTLDKIGREIFPLRERIVKYDKELADMHEKIINNSLDGRPNIFGLATRNVGRDIADYDTSSLPAALFNYRIAEINYHSTTNFWHKEVEDTLDIEVKLNVLDDLAKQFTSLSSLLTEFIKANTEGERRLFSDFLSVRYNGESGLNDFIRVQENFVHSDSIQLHEWFEKVKEQDGRSLWHNSFIPLLVGNKAFNLDSALFSTILVDSLESRKMAFYSWFEKKDSLFFTFGISPSSRVLDTLYSLPISPELKAAGMDNLEILTDSISINERIWVVTSTVAVKKVFNVEIFTSQLNKGLGWQKEYALPQQPKRIQINSESKLITLLNENEEVILVIDESGNIIK